MIFRIQYKGITQCLNETFFDEFLSNFKGAEIEPSWSLLGQGLQQRARALNLRKALASLNNQRVWKPNWIKQITGLGSNWHTYHKMDNRQHTQAQTSTRGKKEVLAYTNRLRTCEVDLSMLGFSQCHPASQHLKKKALNSSTPYSLRRRRILANWKELLPVKYEINTMILPILTYESEIWGVYAKPDFTQNRKTKPFNFKVNKKGLGEVTLLFST